MPCISVNWGTVVTIDGTLAGGGRARIRAAAASLVLDCSPYRARLFTLLHLDLDGITMGSLSGIHHAGSISLVDCRLSGAGFPARRAIQIRVGGVLTIEGSLIEGHSMVSKQGSRAAMGRGGAGRGGAGAGWGPPRAAGREAAGRQAGAAARPPRLLPAEG